MPRFKIGIASGEDGGTRVFDVNNEGLQAISNLLRQSRREEDEEGSKDEKGRGLCNLHDAEMEAREVVLCRNERGGYL